jgi:DNA invertase Pin-like site-specific DNA recombinase
MATYGYMRCSGLGQVDGDTWDRQRAAIEKKALAESWVLDMVVAEEGICGATEGSARPAWAHLLSICQPGDRIVVERLDRFARSLMTQEVMLADLRKRNVTLISALEADIDSSDPTRTLVRQVLGAIAEYDRAMVTSKLRHAREQVRARSGKCEGRKAYGDNHQEVAVVARMRALRADGLSFAAVAARLNDEGIRPRSARRWSAATVCNILRRVPSAAISSPAIQSDLIAALVGLGASRREAGELSAQVTATDFDGALRQALAARNRAA